MESVIFHIDVNSAFLSWTSVHNLETGSGPDLRTIPAIIGGDKKNRHGIVLAKSESAKTFGIHTGTGSRALPCIQQKNDGSAAYVFPGYRTGLD